MADSAADGLLEHADGYHNPAWRIFRIMAEFVDSFEVLSQVGPGVTVFGSARVTPSNPYYKAAVELAKGLAKNNLAIITGGCPGIMEAANRGASQVKGKSVSFRWLKVKDAVRYELQISPDREFRDAPVTPAASRTRTTSAPRRAPTAR